VHRERKGNEFVFSNVYRPSALFRPWYVRLVCGCWVDEVKTRGMYKETLCLCWAIVSCIV
jgi:hypothetical protein